MFGLGPTELIIIAVIILLIFGAKRLPEIGKGLGGAIREFKNIKKEFGHKKEEKKDTRDDVLPKKKADLPGSCSKITDKVMEKIPGAEKVLKIKNHAEKTNRLIK